MPFVIAPALVGMGVSAAVAGPLSSIIFTGISIGLSLLFKPDVPEVEAGRIPFKQGIPNRIRIIGQKRTSGAFMLFHNLKGISLDIQALCDGEVNEFVRHFLHDDKVSFDSLGNITTKPGGGRYGEGRVTLFTRKGFNPSTAYSQATSLLAATDIWTSDHRLDGIASSLLICRDSGADEQATRFPFGLPQYSAVVDATRVYDPRDEDQDALDPSTWSFAGNDNPILQALWILTAPISEGGLGLDLEECFLPVLTQIQTQAEICDEPVARKAGGTDPRYRSHAFYRYSDDPVEALAATLGAGDCFLAENGDGTFVLKAGKWDDSDFEIVFTDKDIIALHVKRFREDEDDVTGVIVKYDSAEHDHVTVDAPVWPRDAYQGGDDRRIRPIDVVFCTDGRQAQRLGKRVAHYEMAEVTGTMVTKIYGITALNKRGATIQCSDDPALANAKVRLLRRELNFEAGTVEFDFQVIDPTVCDAWDPATEEGPLQPVVTLPSDVDEELSTPTNIIAVASEVGGNIYVVLSFDPGEVTTAQVSFRVRYRLADIGGGTPGGWSVLNFPASSVERPDDSTAVIVINGLGEGHFDFQIQAYKHEISAWSISASVDTRFSSPGRPTAFEADLSGSDVVLTWHAPNSSNFDHARAYRATSGAGFGLSIDISGEIAGSPNAPMTFTDVAPASATYDYWVVAENAADVASIPRGPETVTVP